MPDPSLPWTRMLCDFFFDSIQTGAGNDNYPGPCEVYASYVDALGRIWSGTYLPIFVILANDGYATIVNFGEDQYGPGPPYLGDRGEIYSWVERQPGEVWCGAYSGTDRVFRMCGSTREGFSYIGDNSIDRGWRPRCAATDGVSTFWAIGPVNSSGDFEFGGILEVDANGVGIKHSDIVNQDIWVMKWDPVKGKIQCVASGEGIPTAKGGVDFYQIDPTTWTVDWSVGLAGDRGLSMHQLDDDRWVVVSHLTSTTEARLQVVNTDTQTREWARKFDGSGDAGAGPAIPVYGRLRNSIVEFDGRLWHAATDYILEIDVDGQDLIPRCNVSKRSDNIGSIRVTNLVGHPDHGLVMGVGNRMWAWDPR